MNPTMKNWILNRPWIWIWVAFAVLLPAWAVMITLAVKHQPQTIEVAKPAYSD